MICSALLNAFSVHGTPAGERLSEVFLARMLRAAAAREP